MPSRHSAMSEYSVLHEEELCQCLVKAYDEVTHGGSYANSSFQKWLCPHIIRPRGPQHCNYVWARSCTFHSRLLWHVYKLKIGSEQGPQSARLLHGPVLKTSRVLTNKPTGGKNKGRKKDISWSLLAWNLVQNVLNVNLQQLFMSVKP